MRKVLFLDIIIFFLKEKFEYVEWELLEFMVLVDFRIKEYGEKVDCF